MILAEIDGHEERVVNKSSFTQNLSNLLGNTSSFSPDYNLNCINCQERF